MKNWILVFPRRAEARKNEFWPFRAARKYEKTNFGLSAPRFSMKKRILVFPRHALAWKNEFWPFRAARKHEKLNFGLSAPRGSMKKWILAFPRRAITIFLFFSPWNIDKIWDECIKEYFYMPFVLIFFVPLLRLVWEQLNNYCNTS